MKQNASPIAAQSKNLLKLDHIAHGFFGARGGVSSGVYSSLNCGPGSNDDKASVAKNREIAMIALGATTASLCTLYQCHSDKVITIEDTYDGGVEADALATNVPGKVLGILTADCTPVLFADPEHNVIGAAHAGWKGAFGGILENTVSAMEKLGAKRNTITAVIGPCIRQNSYEVGPEFRIRFMEASMENERFFRPSRKPEHYMFDLAGYCAKRLNAIGLAAVEDVKRDTLPDTGDFFSFRRNTLAGVKDYGRQLSAIVLR
ncbi:MAG: peptidoglycan editing factor PgeF [Proteobacteria bacterium]|nr:peptidoglycan editing factor PgeF [Pseudomonadota bacterium]